MAYEKNTWASGDVITAEKLNNMEDGIEDAGRSPLAVNPVGVGEGHHLDKTWAEIDNAFPNVYLNHPGGGHFPPMKIPATVIAIVEGDYVVMFEATGMEATFTAASADGYPVVN